MNSITAKKKALRTEIMQFRRSFPADAKAKADAAIAEAVLQQAEFQSAEQVFAYVAMPHEVGTKAILQGILEQGKVLGLPVCDAASHTLTFYRLDSPEELQTGMYRIPVPPTEPDRILIPDKTTLVLVPMLAIDHAGYRLGAGGGYYDRFLAAYGNIINTLGICYAENCLAELPHDQYDQRILSCITEQKREEHND